MDSISVAGESLRPLFAALQRAQARAERWKFQRKTHAELIRRGRMLLAEVGLALVPKRAFVERRASAGHAELVLERSYALVHENGTRIELAARHPVRSTDSEDTAWVSDAIKAHVLEELLLVASACHREHAHARPGPVKLSSIPADLAARLARSEPFERDQDLAAQVLACVAEILEDGIDGAMHVLEHGCEVEPGETPTVAQLRRFVELLGLDVDDEPSASPGSRNGTHRGAP